MFGLNEPGPTVSLTSRLWLFFQCTNVSHIEWSSAGHLLESRDPPGAVFASFGGGVPPQATSAPAPSTESEAAARTSQCFVIACPRPAQRPTRGPPPARRPRTAASPMAAA